MNSFLPRRDADLLNWSSNFAEIVTAKFATLFMTQAQAEAISDAQKDFANAMALLAQPATRTKLTVADKDAKKKILLDLCSAWGRTLEAHPGVSEAQLIELRLTVKKPPTPAPIPGIPVLEVPGVSGNNVDVLVHAGGDNRRGKPARVAYIGIFAYIGEEPTLEFNKWTLMGTLGRTKTTVAFDATLAPGTKVWLSACYFNTRKEAGQLCNPVGVNLQGGAMSAVPTAMKLAA